jgi:hypothetical protein
MALFRSDTTARRVTTPDGRADALSVLDATYAKEKAWVDDAESAFPGGELGDDDVTWLLATVDDEPAGVLRLHYDPPLHRYDEYGFERLEGAEGLDVDAFVRERSIAEIGRFAVLPKYRGRLRVLFWLMRAAGVDTLERGYTHYVTDIFEGEEHSPYAFHTRVLGFRPVAAHETGEMNCLHRRITLVLNLKAAYERLHATKNRLYRFLTEGLDASLQKRLRV